MDDLFNINVTFDGQLANKVMVKPVFYTPEFTDFVTVHGDIKSKKQLILDEILEYILQKNEGCGRTPSGNVINITEKWLEVCSVKVNLNQCAAALRGTFFEDFLNSGLEEDDLNGTYIKEYMLEKIVAGLKLDVWRVMWFGDASSEDPNYNICTGFWPRIFASVGQYDNNIKRVVISGNDAYVNEDGTLKDCAAIDILRAMRTTASDLLDEVEPEGKYIGLTRSLYENYIACLEDKCCGDRGVIMLTDQSNDKQYLFKAIKVYRMRGWDRYIKKDLNSEYPHRAIYTTKENLALGVDALGDEARLRFIYDDVEELNYVDAKFKMGTQIVYEEFTVVAY